MVEEHIEIDPELINRAFQRGLSRGKLDYLDELQKRALSDYELEGEEEMIVQSFHLMKRFIGSQGAHISALTLRDWEQFGLSKSVITRIGYLAHQIDTDSPPNSPKKKPPRGYRSNGLNGSKTSEENYEDEEFEDIDEDNSLTETYVHNDSSQELYSNRRRHSFGEGDTVAFKVSRDFSDVEESLEKYEQKEYTSSKSDNVEQQRVAIELSEKRRSSNRLRPKSSVIDLHHHKEEDSRRAATAFAAPPTAASAANFKRKPKQPSWIKSREWRLGECIGSGSFGEVFRGMNNKGKLFAVKRLNIAEKRTKLEELFSEIDLMRGLSHPHIVEYIGALVDEKDPILYIFLELVPGGSVASLLKNFGPFRIETVQVYARQILLGLQYLHANNIVHRDIKGGNILVDDTGKVKLADFGASVQLSFDQTQETSTIKGTPYFMSPEVLSNSRYGRKGDVWAVGCTIIQMLTGEPPWKEMNIKGLVQLHVLLANWDKGPPPLKCEVTADCWECLVLCFKKDDKSRPTVVQLLECQFLKDDDMEDSNVSSGFEFSQDNLDDSGVMTGLRRDMDRVVSKSVLGLQANGGKNEDTMSAIDRQIYDRQARRSEQQNRAGRESGDHNPFMAKKETVKQIPYSRDNFDSARDYNQPMGNVVKWAEGVLPPPSPMFLNPDGPQQRQQQPQKHLPVMGVSQTPPRVHNNGQQQQHQQEQAIHMRMQSNPNTPGLRITDVNTPMSQPVTARSANPFARGATSLKSQDAGSNGNTPTNQSNSGSSATSPADDIVGKKVSPRIARFTPRGNYDDAADDDEQRDSGGSANAPVFGLQSPVAGCAQDPNYSRDKLAMIKKKTTNYKSTSSSAQASQQGRGSISSLPSVNTSTGGAHSARGHYRSNSNAGGINQSSNRDSEELTPLPMDHNEHEEGMRVGVRRGSRSSRSSFESEHRPEPNRELQYAARRAPNAIGDSVTPRSRSSTASQRTSRRGNGVASGSEDESHLAYHKESNPNFAQLAESDFAQVAESDWEMIQLSPGKQSSNHGSNGVRSRENSVTPRAHHENVQARAQRRSFVQEDAAKGVNKGSSRASEALNAAISHSRSGSNDRAEAVGGGQRFPSVATPAAGDHYSPRASLNNHIRPSTQAQPVRNTASRSSANGSSRMHTSVSTSAINKPTTHPRDAPNSGLGFLSQDGAESGQSDNDSWVCKKCNYENINPLHCDNCATIKGADGRRGEQAVPLYRGR